MAKKKDQSTKKDPLVEALERALRAAEDVIAWYENDNDRGCIDDIDVPKDLANLETVLDAALEAVVRAKP